MPVAVPPSLVDRSDDAEANCGIVDMMLKSRTDITKPKQTLEDFPSIMVCKILLLDKRSDVYDLLQTAAGLNI